MKVVVVIFAVMGVSLFALHGVRCVLGVSYASIAEENRQLKQQLGQAKVKIEQAREDSLGRPINIVNLPDGNYSLVQPEGYAFVRHQEEHPFADTVFAVIHSGKISQNFALKDVRKQVAEFLEKNPLPTTKK